MGLISGIAVFIMIWWVVIFAVLPWGNETNADGKIINPRIKQKFIVTTLISCAIWLCVYTIIASDFISFRELSMQMMEDY